jgi:hypothetical protein
MRHPVQVSREQVLAYRAKAQELHRSTNDPRSLAVLDIGVQETGGESARLAFDARLRSVPAADGVGPGEPIALVWSMRGAPHLHRRADLDGLAGALWPLSEADAVARLDASASVRKAGIPALDAYIMSVDALRKSVRRPMGKGAASAAVTNLVPAPLTRECRACKARHVFEMPFRMGALSAGIELEPGTSPPVLVPRKGAVSASAVDVPALQRLIFGYLTLLGPARSADVAGYLGARRADLEAVWPDGLSEVQVDGRTAWLPADRVRALRTARMPQLVRLLGAFDPWLQARDRELIVPETSVHKALWPVLGRPGVVLVDGEVAGTWRPKAAGSKLTLTVEPFGGLPAPVWALVEKEAERVGAVRGASQVSVRRIS